MLKTLGYAFSIIFALSFLFGLFLIMMPLSDPYSFGQSSDYIPKNMLDTDLRDTLEVGGFFTLLGLIGNLCLYRFYRDHRFFLGSLGRVVSILAFGICIIWIAVLIGSHPPLLFIITSIVLLALIIFSFFIFWKSHVKNY